MKQPHILQNMDVGSTAAMLTDFKPVFNRVRGMLDPSFPHARNAALLPFLLYAHVSESDHLHILASDFHCNTWHAHFSYDDLNELKVSLGVKESFSAFLQGLYRAFASSELTVELGGPASALGGKGATSAKLKANLNVHGASREVALDLEVLKGLSAYDVVGALALDLYDAFVAAKSIIAELETKEKVREAQTKDKEREVQTKKEREQRSSNVSGTVQQGNANSSHLRPSIPKTVHNEVWTSRTEIPSSILMPFHKFVPSITMNSFITSPLPPPMPPGHPTYQLPYTGASIEKHVKQYKSSIASNRERRNAGTSALKKLVDNNSTRATKPAEKRVESLTNNVAEDSQVLSTSQRSDSIGCSAEAKTSDKSDVGDSQILVVSEKDNSSNGSADRKTSDDATVGNHQSLPATQTFSSVNCSGEPKVLHSSCEKRKYREIDADILAKVDLQFQTEAEGESRCAKTEWVRRHYSDWRKNQGLPHKEIEDLPLPDFAESLVNFFCMVKKRNGDLFPTDSLKAMYRGFGRIIDSHYKKLAVQGKHNEPIVDVGRDALFEKSRVACIGAMKHSLLMGATQNKRKKQVSLVSLETILSDPSSHVTSSEGLLRRLCCYAIHKFHITGSMELYDTTDLEFQRVVNERGEVFWEYDEKRALKYKSKQTFRAAAQCSEKDVVMCLETYFMHLPPKPHEEEPRRLFLAPIKRPTSNVWYRHQNIGVRTLQKWYKYMCPPVSDYGFINEDAHASSILSRDSMACNEKEENSSTDRSFPTSDSEQRREPRKQPNHEFSDKIVEITSSSDDDYHSETEGDNHEMTDADSHEPTIEAGTNSSTVEMDEVLF